MKKRISIFILYLAFWWLLFILARISFLWVYFSETVQLPVFEIFKTFIYGFKLDIAIAAYLVFVPSLFLAFFSLLLLDSAMRSIQSIQEHDETLNHVQIHHP